MKYIAVSIFKINITKYAYYRTKGLKEARFNP